MKEEKLCQLVEKTAGRKMKSHRNFLWLADELERRTGHRLSPTTLKRIWGYVDEPGEPSQFSLDVLAQYAGLANYDAFLHLQEEPSSDLFLAGGITEKNFRDGMRLRLRWQPNRVCLVEYQGGGRWKVLEAQNGTLSVGDIFSCHVFIMHEPLYIDDLVHEGQEYLGYVAGSHSGITFEVVS